MVAGSKRKRAHADDLRGFIVQDNGDLVWQPDFGDSSSHRRATTTVNYRYGRKNASDLAKEAAELESDRLAREDTDRRIAAKAAGEEYWMEDVETGVTVYKQSNDVEDNEVPKKRARKVRFENLKDLDLAYDEDSADDTLMVVNSKPVTRNERKRQTACQAKSTIAQANARQRERYASKPFQPAQPVKRSSMKVVRNTLCRVQQQRLVDQHISRESIPCDRTVMEQSQKEVRLDFSSSDIRLHVDQDTTTDIKQETKEDDDHDFPLVVERRSAGLLTPRMTPEPKLLVEDSGAQLMDLDVDSDDGYVTAEEHLPQPLASDLNEGLSKLKLLKDPKIGHHKLTGGYGYEAVSDDSARVRDYILSVTTPGQKLCTATLTDQAKTLQDMYFALHKEMIGATKIDVLPARKQLLSELAIATGEVLCRIKYRARGSTPQLVSKQS